MSTLPLVTLIGLLAGTLGTASGGTLATLVRPGQRFVGGTLGFSAGIMLAVLTFDLLPQAIETGGAVLGVAGLILGTLLIVVADRFIPHQHAFGTGRKARLLRASLVIGVGIAMHNLPEGLAIGAGYVHQPGLGLAVAIAIGVHNVPEGLAMGLSLRIAGVSAIRVITATFLAGLPMGIGALLGGMLGTASPSVLALSLGFAAGAMLFTACDELIPSANELSNGHEAAFGTTAGLIAGLLILLAIPH